MNSIQAKRRDSYLKRKYGISLLQYRELLDNQGGKCPVCLREYGKDVEKNFAVDHDHKTMEIRGLLCMNCNHRVVGRHRDPELLRRAADYLERHTGLFMPKRKRR